MSVYAGRAHRCSRHDRARCRLSHQALPYVRTGGGSRSIGEWTPAYAPDAPAPARWRYALAVVVGVLVAMLIVLAVVIATEQNRSDREQFARIVPVVTPTPTPYPGGWTP